MKNLEYGKNIRILIVALLAIFIQVLFVTPVYALEGEEGQETILVQEETSINTSDIKTEEESISITSKIEEPITNKESLIQNSSNNDLVKEETPKLDNTIENSISSNTIINNKTNDVDNHNDIIKNDNSVTNTNGNTNIETNNNINNNKEAPKEEAHDNKKNKLRSGETHDVSSYITDAMINTTVNENGEYEVNTGTKFDVILQFAETTNHQFPNSGTLVYNLPAGFDIDLIDEEGTFNIVVATPEGNVTVKNNHFTIKDGVISINWSEDENVHTLFAANNAKFFIRFNGYFDGSKDVIEYNDVVVTPLDFNEEESSLEMIKKSTPAVFSNLPSVNPKINYIISLNSTGTNQDIHITDTISGNGVTLDPSSFVVTSNYNINYNITVDEATNTFTFEADKMVDGQTVTITYSATLDEKLAIRDEDDTFYINANNMAILKSEGHTDITEETNDKIEIKPSIQKVGTIIDENHIKWVINVNVNNKLLIKDMPVIDTINPGSEDYISYSGTGLTVKVYNANGELIRTDNIAWSDLTAFAQNGWTYTIPTTDDYYRYEIEYTTTYDDSGSDKVVENDVHFGDNDTSAGVYVHGEGDVNLEKEAKEVNLEEETVTWEIVIHVPSVGLDSTNNTLTEMYPSVYIPDLGRTVVEPIIDGSIKVYGLLDNESYSINLFNNYATITFTKDGVAGLSSTSLPRDIRIELKTAINQDWLEQSNVEARFINHTNTAIIGNKTEQGVARVALPTIIKDNSEVKTVTIDGTEYPVYKYTVLMGMLGEDTLQLDDTFDTSIFSMYIPEDNVDDYLITLGGDTIYNQTNPAGGWNARERIDYIQTATGIKFLITPDKLAKKADRSLYSYYSFSYYLIPKNLAALRELMQRAAASQDSTYKFDNTISYKDELTASAEGIYQYTAINKKVTGYDPDTAIVSFEIEINPDAIILNDMGKITLVDTFENFSIIYDSIIVTPSDGISFDSSGNSLTFTLPDAKKITITYSGRLIYEIDNFNDVSVDYHNAAALIAGENVYESVVEDTAVVTSHGGGEASVYGVNLLKYEAGNMTVRLAGAVFELLDENFENILDKNGNKVSFTSDSNGKILVEGDQEEDGWSISPDIRYYLREVEAPSGYKLATFDYSFMVASNGKADYSQYIYHNGDTLTAKNYPGTDISVDKVWEDGADKHEADTITVKLQEKVGDGDWADSNVDNINLSAENDWHNSFAGLPLVVTIDDEDLSIEYRVIEVLVNGEPVNEDNYVVITNVENKSYTVVNKASYTTSGEVTFSGEKTLTGKELEEGKYSFELLDSEGNVIETVTNKADGTFTFTTISYTEEDLDKDDNGNYISTTKTYTIREVEGSEAGVTYDSTTYNFTITLTDNGEGKINVESNQDLAKFDFENTYNTTGEVTFSGEKTLTGKELEEGKYSFELLDSEGKVIETVTNNADGTFEFTTICFTEDDLDKDENGNYVETTKSYTIREVKGNEAGVTYDDTTYEFNITLTDNCEGKIIVRSTQNLAKFDFENTYNTTGEVTFSGEKTLTGKELEEGKYSFELLDSEGNVLETVTNKADGTFSFTTISFTEEDLDKDDDGNYVETTKSYTIREVKGNEAGVTYDDTVYEFTVTLTDGGNGTINVESTQNLAKFDFENTYNTTGEVTFSGEKTLTGKELEEGKYSFELLDSEGKVIETVTNKADGTFEFTKIEYTEEDLDKDDDGNYVETTKSYTIREVKGNEAGVTYDDTVYEFTVTLTDGGNGKINVESDQNLAKFDFENTYSTSGEVTFSGEKTLTGKELEEGKYSFELLDSEGNVLETVTNKTDGTFSFSTISFTEDDLDKDDNGNYVETTKSYTIREVKGNEPGVTYDDTIYEFTVTLTDGGNGKINVESNQDLAKFDFENTYNTTGEVTFSGEKTLTGKELEESKYSFELLDSEGNVIETVTNKADGTFEFTKIEYTENDLDKDDNGNYVETTKSYTIREVKGEEPGVTYDDTAYEFTVTLTDGGNGKINVESDQDLAKFDFENTYNTTGEVTFSGEKTLTGKELEEGKYSFELLDSEGKVIETVTNKADGTFEFTKIEYTEEDLDKDDDGNYISTTKTYTIREVKGEEPGVTYDDTVYEFTVTLTDGGNGKINVESTQNLAKFNFENTYNTSGEVTFSGEKTLTGKEIEEGKYSFELLDSEGNVIETVTNKADGTFEFTTISFTEDDLDKDENGNYVETTKTYTIKEVKGEEPGVTYDSTEYTFTVTLKDNSEGKIEVESDQDLAKFDFENTYSSSGEVTFSGEKTLTGKELEEGKYSFELLDSEGNVIETVTNKADGTFEFTKIEYTEEDLDKDDNGNYVETTKSYTIREVKGEEPGVTYDDTTYEFTVTLKDNGEGKIEVESNQDLSKFDFENSYEAYGEAIISVIKELIGRNWNSDDEFEFILTADEGTPLPEITTITITKDNIDYSSNFGIIRFNKEGTYTYTISETHKGETIDGIDYDSEDKIVTITLTDDHKGNLIADVEDNLYVVKFINEYHAHILVDKIDITTREELEGAVIQIIDKSGNVVEEWTSTKEAHLVEGLKTNEEYTLKEIVAPEGYKVTTDITFTIDENERVITTGTTTIDEEGNTVLLVEDEITKISIIKVDITTGEELEGAVIQIIDKDGNVVEEWTSTKEAHLVEGLKTNEEYTLKEIVAPEGYKVTTDTTFTIDENGRVTSTGTTTTDEEGNTVLLVEDEITKVSISKVDVETGEDLEGATIQIIDKNGNVVEEWISTKEPHIIEGLKTNEVYILKEIKAPEGYEIANEITFTIDENGKVKTTGKSDIDENGNTVLIIQDEKTPIKIQPEETPTKNPMTADYFNLYFILLQIFILGFTSGALYLRKLNLS